MSGSLNRVMLIGNLGEKPKIHRFDENNSIVRFPLATSESYVKKGSNEKIDHTEWHNIVVRNKLGEICEKFLNKGDKIFIEGKIKSRKWEDDAKNIRYTTEIIADNVKFLTLKKTDSANNDEVNYNSEDFTEDVNSPF